VPVPGGRDRTARVAASASARLAAALTALVVLLAGCTASNARGDTYQFKGSTKFGTVIPPAQRKPIGRYSAKLLDGGTYSFAQARGKAVVVNFWASWCGPCATETPQFEKIYRQYKTRQVTFLGVDFKDDRGAARSFVHDNKITYPIVFDQDGQSAIQLGNIGIQGLPYTLVLDRRHRVAGIYSGPMLPADLEPVLNKVDGGT
jgi:peroxiredoxin